ncbi:MAG TPA: hypothetical protein VEL31_25125 [Ktedonobacteraceae bacterium]|nr:hypothetical protein [Ktedonobacteraceae bacterium]
MEEAHTWRDLLGKIVNDPYERQRIADIVGVNPITLTRWANGKSKPRQENLRPLLEVVSQYSSEIARLIALEYPQFFDDGAEAKDALSGIPATFYARVLHTYTTTPPILRASTISALIMQQLLSHLDPSGIGIIVIVSQCVRPPRERKVRSVRITQYRTTMHFESYLEHQTIFLGAESQAGIALGSGHPSIIQNETDMFRMFPTHHFAPNKSAVAYPVLLDCRAAGTLYIASVQNNFFSLAHQNLISNYADLMTLAFEPEDYYDLQEIELGIMPPFRMQQPLLSKFQKRVTQQMLVAEQKRYPLTRTQAEERVWQELEEEFFYIALDLKVKIMDQQETM